MRCLADEAALLQRFVEILCEEQKILTEGDCNVSRLMTLVADKTRYAAQLGSVADQRSAFLAAGGYSPDQVGMQNWLDQSAGRSDAAPDGLWAHILTLAAEARALNATNGHLIAVHLQHNQQALNVLLSAANQAALYGPDGQTHATSGGRLFGAA